MQTDAIKKRSPASCVLQILRYSREGRAPEPSPLDADEWRRWAARVYSQATREVGQPALEGVPKSRSDAEDVGDLKRWEVCRAAHLMARHRAKRVALVLAHMAVERSTADPGDSLWGQLAQQYRALYLEAPGGHPEDDEHLSEVVQHLQDSEACAQLSLKRSAGWFEADS